MKNTFDQTVNFMIKFQRLYKKITSFGPLEKDNGLFWLMKTRKQQRSTSTKNGIYNWTIAQLELEMISAYTAICFAS
jgi:hypothetical protein